MEARWRFGFAVAGKLCGGGQVDAGWRIGTGTGTGTMAAACGVVVGDRGTARAVSNRRGDWVHGEARWRGYWEARRRRLLRRFSFSFQSLQFASCRLGSYGGARHGGMGNYARAEFFEGLGLRVEAAERQWSSDGDDSKLTAWADLELHGTGHLILLMAEQPWYGGLGDCGRGQPRVWAVMVCKVWFGWASRLMALV
ncbi:hypothetical protein M0R45_009174 [Rubus argutus]|uniref:MHC class I antigen n=1 Tax=Rubus argutus TaxID=59490 RepID=A0AAW1Y531_RUBAR